MTFYPMAANPAYQRQADLENYAQPDSSPTLLSWTAPNDGKNHGFYVTGTQHVASNLTGGAIAASFTDPQGGTGTIYLIGNSNTAGTYAFADGAFGGAIIGPGTSVQLNQYEAVTAGSGTVSASIWGY